MSSEKNLTSAELLCSMRRAVESLDGELTIDGLDAVTVDDVELAIEELRDAHACTGRVFTLVQYRGAWRFEVAQKFVPLVAVLQPEIKPQKLKSAQLEVLTIVAYKQPVTKHAIEAIRGMTSSTGLQDLLDIDLIEFGGRSDLPGRPPLYVTTQRFLDEFGIATLEDLPNIAALHDQKNSLGSAGLESEGVLEAPSSEG